MRKSKNEIKERNGTVLLIGIMIILVSTIGGCFLFTKSIMKDFGKSMNDSLKKIRSNNGNKLEPSIKIPNDKNLQGDTISITLEYYGMMCDCPQWITPENRLIYEKSIEMGNTISEDSVFIRLESANHEIINPFDLVNNNNDENIFKFVGQYYEGKYEWVSEDNIKFKTKVFKYYECQLKNKVTNFTE